MKRDSAQRDADFLEAEIAIADANRYNDAAKASFKKEDFELADAYIDAVIALTKVGKIWIGRAKRPLEMGEGE